MGEKDRSYLINNDVHQRIWFIAFEYLPQVALKYIIEILLLPLPQH